jgi:hypothetical protein
MNRDDTVLVEGKEGSHKRSFSDAALSRDDEDRDDMSRMHLLKKPRIDDRGGGGDVGKSDQGQPFIEKSGAAPSRTTTVSNHHQQYSRPSVDMIAPSCLDKEEYPLEQRCHYRVMFTSKGFQYKSGDRSRGGRFSCWLAGQLVLLREQVYFKFRTPKPFGPVGGGFAAKFFETFISVTRVDNGVLVLPDDAWLLEPLERHLDSRQFRKSASFGASLYSCNCVEF